MDQSKWDEKLIEDLSKMLCLITGFDEVSLQPNSGAQGEYAGLMTIKAYLNDKDQTNRNSKRKVWRQKRHLQHWSYGKYKRKL